tara:strand:+ start:498 stop:863 length:366 start_codon:yes stop_codon:yes gene_type:complete
MSVKKNRQYAELPEEEKAKLKKKVIKPKKNKKNISEKLKAFSEITGIDPLQDFLEGPTQINMTPPDLASDVRARVEQQKARIASAPKMFPMYYENANKGKFFNKTVKAKCKLGKTKKTKLY